LRSSPSTRPRLSNGTRTKVGRLLDERGHVVCERCVPAKSLWARTRGLLGRKGLPPGEGLLIPRTSSIHTFFMRFPIDVVFLDRGLAVRSIARGVRPFRIVIRVGSKSVLELAAGEAARVGIEQGSRLSWHDGAS
jgi:uncharacterized membrane protein (UPF0127 family)